MLFSGCRFFFCFLGVPHFSTKSGSAYLRASLSLRSRRKRRDCYRTLRRPNLKALLLNQTATQPNSQSQPQLPQFPLKCFCYRLHDLNEMFCQKELDWYIRRCFHHNPVLVVFVFRPFFIAIGCFFVDYLPIGIVFIPTFSSTGIFSVD